MALCRASCWARPQAQACAAIHPKITDADAFEESVINVVLEWARPQTPRSFYETLSGSNDCRKSNHAILPWYAMHCLLGMTLCVFALRIASQQTSL